MTETNWNAIILLAGVALPMLGGLYTILMSYLTIREHLEAMKRIDQRLNDLRELIMTKQDKSH